MQAAIALTLEQKHKMVANGKETQGAETHNLQENSAIEVESVEAEAFQNYGDDTQVEHMRPLVEELDDGVAGERSESMSEYPQAELARKHGLPDDSGFWSLFKAQVMSDFAPFWRVVPAPVKTFCETKRDI